MFTRKLAMSFVIALFALGGFVSVNAQREDNGQHGDWNEHYWHRYNKNQVSQTIKYVETSANGFRRDFSRWLDQSRFDGQTREERFNSKVANFEQATNQLRAEFDRRDSWWETRDNVQQVLDAGRGVQQMMQRQQFPGQLQSEWRRLRYGLNRLATTFRLQQL